MLPIEFTNNNFLVIIQKARDNALVLSIHESYGYCLLSMFIAHLDTAVLLLSIKASDIAPSLLSICLQLFIEFSDFAFVLWFKMKHQAFKYSAWFVVHKLYGQSCPPHCLCPTQELVSRYPHL